jgi:HSP20 family molecular chaperone IbpA
MRLLNTHSDLFPRSLQPVLEKMTESTLAPFLTKWDWDGFNTGSTFAVPVGEGWTVDAYRLRFIIPGIARSEFELLTQGERLILRGRRTKPEVLDGSDNFNFAMPYGDFERAIDLPKGLDLDRMRATFHHGVLDVWIPGDESVKVRVVPISMLATPDKVPAIA